MDDFVESEQGFDFNRMSFFSLVNCLTSLREIAKEVGIESKFEDFLKGQRALFNQRANGTYKGAMPLMKSHDMTKYLVRAGDLFLQLSQDPKLLEEQLQQLYENTTNPKPF